MPMIAALAMTLASISGALERELSSERQDKISIVFFGNINDHFLIVMVVLLDFRGQKMCQGHHTKSD